MYNILHILDEADPCSHFIGYLEGFWWRFERFIRLIIAGILILLMKLTDEQMRSLGWHISGHIEDLMQDISPKIRFSHAISDSSQFLMPDQSGVFALILSSYMILIYMTFIGWDILILTSAKIETLSISKSPNYKFSNQEEKRIKSLIKFFDPQKLKQADGEDANQYQTRILKIIIDINKNGFNWLNYLLNKFCERVLGCLLALILLLSLVGKSWLFILLLGIVAWFYIVFTFLRDGNITEWFCSPFRKFIIYFMHK